MKIYVDIDNTICRTTGCDYKGATPLQNRIKKINKLYELGHEITYWTARGTVTKIDWRELTTKQLEQWGAKYNSLLLGKPAFDMFIDDKAFNCETYFQ